MINLEFRRPPLGSRIQGPGLKGFLSSGFIGPGFRFTGLGFEVRGLGFGISWSRNVDVRKREELPEKLIPESRKQEEMQEGRKTAVALRQKYTVAPKRARI